MADYERLTDDIFNAILDKGLMIHYVPESPIKAPFAYTIGRTLQGRPEFLVTGVQGQGPAAGFLDYLVTADDRSPLRPGDVLPWGHSSLKLIRAHPGLLLGAMATFGSVEVIQALWPDARGLYPDSIGGRTSIQPVCRYEQPLDITWDPYQENE